MLALTKNCNQVSNGKYATDEGEAETIPICQLNGAFFWSSDMDVDCDGKQTSTCNINTDAAFYPDTSAHDSQDNPLDASALPFYVIPLPSSRFSYKSNDLHYGDVAAVVYNGKVAYAVFGDEGPSGIIGEGSVALAKELGIDPDPSTGGTDGPVVFIVFKGTAAVASPIEDHQAAIDLGETLAKQLIQNNP